MIEKQCKICKKTFTPNISNKQIFCSKKCSSNFYDLKFHPRKEIVQKKCVICENFFLSSYSCIICGDIQCQKEWKKRYDKAYHLCKKYPKIECIICKTYFSPKNKRQICCPERKCKLSFKKLRHKQNEIKEKIERKDYNKKNRAKINEKMKTNIQYKIRKRLNNRLAFWLKQYVKKGIQAKKQSKLTILLGCSIPNFIKYIENQFQEGMSWENYGLYGWHLDHKIPCSKFNLSNPEDQKRCFDYTNLQPLWAKENLSKSDKFDVNTLLDIGLMCAEDVI